MMSTAPTQQTPIAPQTSYPAAPSRPTVPALVAAIGALLAAVFSYALGMYMQSGMNWIKRLLMPHMGGPNHMSSTAMAQTLFACTAITVAVLSVAFLVTMKKLRDSFSAYANLWLAVYAVYLLCNAIFFRPLYVTAAGGRLSLLRFFVYSLPTIILLIGFVVLFVTLIRLFKVLNVAGRVFAIIDLIVIAIIGIVLLVDIFAELSHKLSAAVFGSEFSSSFTVLAWLAATLFALTFGKVRSPQPVVPYPGYAPGAYPAQPWSPAPVQQTPQAAPAFQPYSGSGVCDVCNKPLSGRKAWIVPNAVFYASPAWRQMFLRIQQVAGPVTPAMGDAMIAQMQASDHSQGSAVCEDCIHMFQ